MDPYFLLVTVFLVFLMLLVMIFGEKLSVLGAFHGRWFSSIADLFADAVDFLFEAIDHAWDFVLAHVWWVVAVSSGTTGILVTGWLLFGGVAQKAAADVAEISGGLDAGGLLDGIPLIDTTRINTRPVATRSPEPPDSVFQMASYVRNIAAPELPLPPRPDRRPPAFPDRDVPIADGLDDDWPSRSNRFRNRRPWEDRDWRDLDRNTEPVELLGLTMERIDNDNDPGSIIETVGTPVDSYAMEESIDRAVSDLRRYNSEWKEHDPYSLDRRDRDNSRFDLAVDTVMEATPDELARLEDRIRPVTVSGISDTELKIEKRIVRAAGQNAFNIEIDLSNLSSDDIGSIVVREHLPFQVHPTNIENEGIYRDSIVTWLVNDLEPYRTRTLTAQVRSSMTGEFATQTDISAVTAVRTRTEIQPEPNPPRRRTNRAARYPDVRMKVTQIDGRVDVLENLEIPIELTNRGDGLSELVVVRVVLPSGLDHHQLEDDDIDRELKIRIRNLEPGQTRTVPLRIRATESGIQRATVELLERERSLDFTRFTIDARAPSATRDLEPEPDFLNEPNGSL